MRVAPWVPVSTSIPSERRGQTCFRLTPGVIDDDAEEFFGHGHCGMLAGALHEQSGGWPIAVITRGDFWCHAGVITPDRRFLDIYGPRTQNQARLSYQGTNLFIPTRQEAEAKSGVWTKGWDHNLTPSSADLFRDFADTLIRMV